MPSRFRLLLCRLGLVLFCILPTTVVGCWCVAQVWANCERATKNDWERELSQWLGLKVEFETIHYASSGLVEFRGARLVDFRSGKVFASASRIEFGTASDCLDVRLVEPVLEHSGLGQLAALAQERLLSRSAAGSGRQQNLPIRFTAQNALIRQSQGDQTLTQCNGELALGEQRSSLSVTFRLPGTVPEAKPLSIAALRERGDELPVTTWRIDSGTTVIPCALAADLAPGLRCLGPDCLGSGVIELTSSPAGLTGNLAGVFVNVDLDSLVSERFQHQLSGLAEVQIQRARFAAGKLVEVHGTIAATGGSVNRSLLVAAQDHLGLNAAERILASSDEAVPYRRLAIEFHLTGESLTLTGGAAAVHPGVLLANAGGPLLSAAPGHSVAAINLLRALLPDSGYQVPATRQTAALVSLLPVPTAASAQAAPPAAHIPTRLAPATARAPRSTVQQPVHR